MLAVFNQSFKRGIKDVTTLIIPSSMKANARISACLTRIQNQATYKSLTSEVANISCQRTLEKPVAAKS